MPLWYNKKSGLTEKEIRYAMEHTINCSHAADFLNVAYDTFKKYAKQYVDEETGKTLFEIHKDPTSMRVLKDRNKAKTDILEILEGKHPTYPKWKLQRRLLNEGIFDEKCMECGFDEQRITDQCVPLIMMYKNGDITDHRYENIKFVCYNCFFLMYNELFDPRKRIHIINYRDGKV